jgi:ribA/ribD-fused uncharacterized protein
MIKFYKIAEPYGCFSNFSRHKVDIYDRVWMTSEHAYQAQKFIATPENIELIHKAESPKIAAQLGRTLKPISIAWDFSVLFKQPKDSPVELMKDFVMYEVCLAKFSQNQDIKEILLSTGDEEICETTTVDEYWATGKEGKGKNKLGKILMYIRKQLRQ